MAMTLFTELSTFVGGLIFANAGDFLEKLCRWLRIALQQRMGDFVMHCVKVIEGIWEGCRFLVPVLIVMDLCNQVHGLKNAVNVLEEELSDRVHELKNALEGDLKDSDDEGYTTEEN